VLGYACLPSAFAADIASYDSAMLFADADAALEWCEARLIQEEPATEAVEIPLPFAAMDLVAGFDESEVEMLQLIAREARYDPGAIIVREGDPADAVYMLAAGLVTVRLGLSDGVRSKRLSTITPGLAFGELSLFDGGRRSADVVADEPSVCYVLP